MMSSGLYQPLGSYGGAFPLRRIQGSSYAVTGETWWSSTAGAGMPQEYIHEFGGQPSSLEILLVADNPLHTFVTAEDFPGWPNARRLADWYNARHRVNMRIRERMSTSYKQEDSERVENEWVARHALALTDMIRSDPTSEHFAGNLEWSPTTKVYRDGVFWVRVPLPIINPALRGNQKGKQR